MSLVRPFKIMPFAVKTLKSRYFYLILCLVFVLMFPFVNYMEVFLPYVIMIFYSMGKTPEIERL